MRVILAIESTCDETAAAVIAEDGSVLGECVAGQEELHRDFEGVVPEIAARAHLESILPVIQTAMNHAQVQLTDLTAVAVATQPGLPGSLLVGLSAAKGLCLGLGIPLVSVNHMHAHIYACSLARSESIFPCVGFVVSGGHTHLFRCESFSGWELIGGTIDDAAGEAFDKVAVLLGIPFPGGPKLSRLAKEGDPKAFRLPRPLVDDPSRIQFSFSGLKTAVRYQLYGHGAQSIDPSKLDEVFKRNMAASFEQAVLDCLVNKAMLAVEATGLNRLCVGGGVASNEKLRGMLREICEKRQIELVIAAPEYCTDNAVMGGLAWDRVQRGDFDDLFLDIKPGLVR